MDKYSLLDFFLFDQDASLWYNIKKTQNGFEVSTDTNFQGVSLEELVEN